MLPKVNSNFKIIIINKFKYALFIDKNNVYLVYTARAHGFR